MARQVLENGVILPAEYSDDWYDDMTSNLTKLDDVIGSDSEKLSSSDVGAAALSNNYNDLDNLPTIPTVNDATLTIQKNGVDVQTFTANASSNVTANITVPTKTSDLTNDSNFVDTSNSAVASGITSAKVTDYDTHIADTDIHVTTADKNRWNTVSSKANDSDVVHKSGDETVAGVKTFENNRMVVGRSTDISSAIQFVNSDAVGDSANGASSFEVYGSSISDANKIGSITIGEFSNNGGSYATIECNRTVSGVKSSNAIRSLIRPNGSKELSATVDNDCKLGTEFLRWSKIYGTEYYYGSNNVEFSTKFVTTDTAQTISETKTFTNTIKSKKEIELTGSRLAYILPEFSASYSGLSLCTYDASGAVKIGTWKVDDNDNTKHKLDASLGYLNVSTGSSNSVNIVYLTPKNASIAKLGDSVNKWHEINGVEPSSLSMPVFPSQSSWIDISSYITDMTGAVANLYTPPANGYITFSATGNQVQIFSDYGLQSKFSIQSGSTIRGYHPVLKNEPIKIYMIGTSIEFFRFIPCQGNV